MYMYMYYHCSKHSTISRLLVLRGRPSGIFPLSPPPTNIPSRDPKGSNLNLQNSHILRGVASVHVNYLASFPPTSPKTSYVCLNIFSRHGSSCPQAQAADTPSISRTSIRIPRPIAPAIPSKPHLPVPTLFKTLGGRQMPVPPGVGPWTPTGSTVNVVVSPISSTQTRMMARTGAKVGHSHPDVRAYPV